VALGKEAGYSNQGTNAVAIGFQAGFTGQSANSIVLNASNSALNASKSGVFIKPVNTISVLTSSHYPIYFNEVTNEFVYYKP
jgi:hypothetical protein